MTGDTYKIPKENWKKMCGMAAGVAMPAGYLVVQMVLDLTDEERAGHKAAMAWFDAWKKDTFSDTSFVSYLFQIAQGPDAVLWLNDSIQADLEDLEINTPDDQIALRKEIADYTDQLRQWYRHYYDYYRNRRADKNLAEAMGRLLIWRARSRAQWQRNKMYNGQIG